MAETDREQKTEEPTEKRLGKAREDGQVARSTDLNFAAMLLAAAGLSVYWGGTVKEGFHTSLHGCVGALAGSTSHDAALLALTVLEKALLVMAPFLIALVPVAAATSFAQFGIHFLPQKLRPRPEKLQPQLSPSKFVNGKSLIETLTSVLKLVCLVTAFYLAVWSEIPELLATDTLQAIAGRGTWLVVRLLLYIGLTLFGIGLLDLALKKKDQMKDLRMTKDEVRQEVKDAQGDPEVKGRIKRKQKEMALRRMMDAVPTASVVITNPTHYAVALKYEAGMAAPLAVAKGQDFLALRIREVAKKAGVPLIENPPLARALHDAVEPGQEIPAELYQAVAEVLAAIMRTTERVGSHG